MSAGVTKAKSTYYPTFTKYQRTSRLLKIWWANRRNALKKELSKKIAKHVHTSSKDVENNFSLYKRILKNEKAQKQLRLTLDQINFINN